MTKRAIMLALCSLLLLLCALSTRGDIFWLLFWVLGIMLLLSLASVLWTYATLSIVCGYSETQVTRGGRVNITIDLLHRCLLPVGALQLDIAMMGGEERVMLHTPVRPLVVNPVTYALVCTHVGAYTSGVKGARVQDVFGLFSLYRKLDVTQSMLLVLPKIYLTESLLFSPGESDTESSMARAFEDATMPSDLRAFQQGDELKKVHWKLSMRRKELLVRVYEQPLRPDALLLVDCAPPDGPPELQPTIRDAICEGAASVASIALQDGAPVRMPLLTENPVDINGTKPEDIMLIRTALAHCAFDGTQAFERVLMLETRRMRRTGTTAVITSRLNPTLADMIMRIRRMGPKVRLFLAADGEDETIALLITRLMRNDIEVVMVEV